MVYSFLSLQDGSPSSPLQSVLADPVDNSLPCDAVSALPQTNVGIISYQLVWKVRTSLGCPEMVSAHSGFWELWLCALHVPRQRLERGWTRARRRGGRVPACADNVPLLLPESFVLLKPFCVRYRSWRVTAYKPRGRLFSSRHNVGLLLLVSGGWKARWLFLIAWSLVTCWGVGSTGRFELW